MTSLLLLDLDGVVIFEIVPPVVANPELVLLHTVLQKPLDDLGIPVVIVTHRSRAEANLILRTAGLTARLAGVIAAEDIFNIAICSPLRFARHGLRKSSVIDHIERRFQVSRRNIAFIDDRRDILEDMLRNGLGLALHAPSGFAGRDILSFNFHEVKMLIGRNDGPNFVSLRPETIGVNEWQHTGINTNAASGHFFNRLRRLRRRIWTRAR